MYILIKHVYCDVMEKEMIIRVENEISEMHVINQIKEKSILI